MHLITLRLHDILLGRGRLTGIAPLHRGNIPPHLKTKDDNPERLLKDTALLYLRAEILPQCISKQRHYTNNQRYDTILYILR